MKSSTLVSLLFCVFLPLVAPVFSTVLGIDFGSDSVKVAAVAPGRSFEIVLDESSKRSHPALIVFDDQVRQYGTNARSLVSRRPQKSLLSFSRLLGKPHNTSLINELKSDFIFPQIVKDEPRGTVRYLSPYYKASSSSETDPVAQTESFSVEEVMTMKLSHIKRMAETSAGTEIVDCVFTVPEFWSNKERRALLDAAQLADLNVFAVINENSAAGLQYSINRDYEVNKTETFMFYNMGATTTQVNIMRFYAWETGKSKNKKTVGGVEVLSQSWDETLGANNFDRVIAQMLMDPIRELMAKNGASQSEIDSITTNARAMTRLRTAVQRAKKVLSANVETRVYIEGLYNDNDFSREVKRSQFEDNAAPLFKRAMLPIDIALERAALSREDLTGIVLVGGGTRIPGVLAALESQQVDLRKDLNADEAPAMGAAFRAANLSSAFRVRSIGFEDISPFPVQVRITNLDNTDAVEPDTDTFSKRGELFVMNNHLHKRRAVSVKHDKDMFVEVFYSEDAPLPLDTSRDLGTYKVSGVPSAITRYSCDEYNITDLPKVSLSFLLDSNGIVDLVSATATFTEWYTDEIKHKKETQRTEDMAETEEESTEALPETVGDEEAPETTSVEPEYEIELVNKKRAHKVTLKVTKSSPNDVKPYSEEDFIHSRKILLELDDRDRSVLETNAARNALESYIFESRNRLYEDVSVQKVSTEEERETLSEVLTAAEDWIWDVEEETVSVFKGKLRELMDSGAGVFGRAFEYIERPKVVEYAGKSLHRIYELADVLRANYTWISSNDTDRLEVMARKSEEWLNEKIEAQSEKSLLETPAFLAKDVSLRIEPIMKYAQQLISRQPPKDFFKKSKKKSNATKSDNETDSESESDDPLTADIDTGDESETFEELDKDDESNSDDPDKDEL